jgi:lipoic acid synthetase
VFYDFQGNIEQLKLITDANPDVIAHNVETVRRLQKKARDPRANYEQSLKIIKHIKLLAPHIFSKSAIMVGLGETEDEVKETMDDLRSINCDILTIGQYLKPKNKFLQVDEYVRPQIFRNYKDYGDKVGFMYTASGPFVRSSYRAGELFIKSVLKEREENNQITQTKHQTQVS